MRCRVRARIGGSSSRRRPSRHGPESSRGASQRSSRPGCGGTASNVLARPRAPPCPRREGADDNEHADAARARAAASRDGAPMRRRNRQASRGCGGPRAARHPRPLDHKRHTKIALAGLPAPLRDDGRTRASRRSAATPRRRERRQASAVSAARSIERAPGYAPAPMLLSPRVKAIHTRLVPVEEVANGTAPHRAPGDVCRCVRRVRAAVISRARPASARAPRSRPPRRR